MKIGQTEYRTYGYRHNMNTDWPVQSELRREGKRLWYVTTGICNGIADSQAVAFKTERAAREAFTA